MTNFRLSIELLLTDDNEAIGAVHVTRELEHVLHTIGASVQGLAIEGLLVNGFTSLVVGLDGQPLGAVSLEENDLAPEADE